MDKNFLRISVDFVRVSPKSDWDKTIENDDNKNRNKNNIKIGHY